jgi:hypothetical protein
LRGPFTYNFRELQEMNLDDLASRRISLRDMNHGYAALRNDRLTRIVVTSFWPWKLI